jgi:putative acetyltransferase
MLHSLPEFPHCETRWLEGAEAVLKAARVRGIPYMVDGKLGNKNLDMNLREYTEADLAAIASLFTASVHELGAPHYDISQREAWAPIPPDLETWATRLAKLHTLLASEGSELAGFISYELNGHIEFLYTGPVFERRGVASLLYQHVQNALSGIELFTEASLIAKPFFLRQGFHVLEEQRVIRRGIAFRRFAMRKAVLAQQSVQADGHASGVSAA